MQLKGGLIRILRYLFESLEATSNDRMLLLKNPSTLQEIFPYKTRKGGALGELRARCTSVYSNGILEHRKVYFAHSLGTRSILKQIFS